MRVLVLPCLAALMFVVVVNGNRALIFNFGDSNSDTGGYSAGTGVEIGYPYGRAFFHPPTGRASDGRLIIDFLCEYVDTHYLRPYLDSLEPDFRNGVNFAVCGACALPKSVTFNLNTQLLQFKRFYNHSLHLHSNGQKDKFGKEEFQQALYTIDIGQNDLSGSFASFSYAQVIHNIPSFISEIKDAMWEMYKLGGRNFWVHNTGPLGCLPRELALRRQVLNDEDFDEYGCVKSMNDGAQVFNTKLKAICEELQSVMDNSTIVYVDLYSIKYDLFANASSYDREMNNFFVLKSGGKATFSPADDAVNSRQAAAFREKEERRLGELAPKASLNPAEASPVRPVTEAAIPTSDPVEDAPLRRKKKVPSSSQKKAPAKKPRTEEGVSKEVVRTAEESEQVRALVKSGKAVAKGKEKGEEDVERKELEEDLSLLVSLAKRFEARGERAFKRRDRLRSTLQEKHTLESDLSEHASKVENLTVQLEERELELAVARSEVAKKEELLLAKEQFAVEQQTAISNARAENENLREKLEEAERSRAEFGEVMYKNGFYQFARSPEMKLLAEEFRERLVFRLWDSLLFLSKAAPMAVTYFEEAVRLCQERAGEAVQFDVNELAQEVMRTHSVPPGWRGDPNGDINTEQWWSGCLEEALKEVLPDNQLDLPGPSSSLPAAVENPRSPTPPLPEETFELLEPIDAQLTPSPDHT